MAGRRKRPARKGKTRKKARTRGTGARRSGESRSQRVRELLARGMSAGDIAARVGCSRNLVYVIKSNQGAARAGRRRGPGGSRQKAGARRGRGRPRKGGAPAATLDRLLVEFRALERERDRLRRTLERIAAAVDAVV